MKRRLLTLHMSCALLAIALLAPRAHALEFAPDGAVLPIESGPGLAASSRIAAAASHTSSAHRIRAHHRRLLHRHVHHRVRAAAGLQAGRGTSPAHPESQHHPDRRAAVPQVTRSHRPTHEGRYGARGAATLQPSQTLLAASSRSLRALEHDSFGNFAGDRAAGRGPPRAGPDTNLRRRSRPTSAGPSLLSPTPAPDSPLPPPPPAGLLAAPLRPHAASRPAVIRRPEGSCAPGVRALHPPVSDRIASASRPGRVPRFTHPGPPTCVSPVVRVEGAAACSIMPSDGGLT